VRWNLDQRLIPEAVLQTIAETRDSFAWQLRLHPVQKIGPLFKKHRAFLEKVSAANPIVLSRVTPHVSMASMTAYEAAAVGVPTLLLCPTLVGGELHEDTFLDLVDPGVAQKRSYEQPEIIEWIENESNIKVRPQLVNENSQPVSSALISIFQSWHLDSLRALNELDRDTSISFRNIAPTEIQYCVFMAWVGIADLGIGNFAAMAKMVELLGNDVTRVENPNQLRDDSHVILPGVGAFDYRMYSTPALP